MSAGNFRDDSAFQPENCEEIAMLSIERGNRRPAGRFVELFPIWTTVLAALPRSAEVLLAVVLVLVASAPSQSGGISETIPTDWVAITPGPGADILQFIKQLPQDANPLGVRAAHQRTK